MDRSVAAAVGQTLLSAATRDLVVDALPSGLTLRDVGEQRLRNLQPSEPVFQLSHPALEDAFPPSRTPENRPNFPARRPRWSAVRPTWPRRDRLQAADVRLLTLIGRGGTGKPRPAVALAADALDAFPDGAFFVDPAPISDPALVLSAVARTLDPATRAQIAASGPVPA
jgi:hypothetical protein